MMRKKLTPSYKSSQPTYKNILDWVKKTPISERKKIIAKIKAEKEVTAYFKEYDESEVVK